VKSYIEVGSWVFIDMLKALFDWMFWPYCWVGISIQIQNFKETAMRNIVSLKYEAETEAYAYFSYDRHP
jgi:hypothetical protein